MRKNCWHTILGLVGFSCCLLYCRHFDAALAGEANSNVNFNSHIAEIIYENCSGCHRQGQSGPFELLSYADVVRHSETIRVVIEDRYMPPWKPVDTGIEFANHRGLSRQEIDLFAQWIEQGCEEGPPETSPTPPQFPSGWMLGKPDMVIRMQEPFTVPADGPDIYRSFVLPVNLPEDKWVKAIELRPQAPGVVHHALYFVAKSESIRNRAESDGLPGFRGMNFIRGSDFILQSAEILTRGLGGYVPGAVPNLLPGDFARPLPAGHDIILQTHFHPTGKVEVEQSEVAIYFADSPPSRSLVPIQVPPLFGIAAGINIPPGESNFTITDEVELPVDVQAIEIGGHAHYICTKMKLQAELPSGESFTLLQIDQWDLDWQDQYLFKEPIDLPKGTRLRAEISYDNSENNPENPFSPPQRITWGQQSTDEMGSFLLSLTAKQESDAPALQQFAANQHRHAIRQRIRRQPALMAALASGAKPQDGLVQLFDRNRDGALQADEMPERLRVRLLEFLDDNGDYSLDADELQRGFEMLRKMTQDS